MLRFNNSGFKLLLRLSRKSLNDPRLDKLSGESTDRELFNGVEKDDLADRAVSDPLAERDELPPMKFFTPVTPAADAVVVAVPAAPRAVWGILVRAPILVIPYRVEFFGEASREKYCACC